MWSLQAPTGPDQWTTVRRNLTQQQVDDIRQANTADGYVEGVDFRFVQTS